jgi:hypothetical protein
VKRASTPTEAERESRALKEIFEVEAERLLLATGSAMRTLEAPNGSPAAAAVHAIIDRSRKLFVDSAKPRGLFRALSLSEFEEVYRGIGENDEDTPLEHVVEEAVSVALFAVTLGDEISGRIDALFEAGELAEGYILDQVASFAADELATTAGRRFRVRAQADDGVDVLPYSPGYCGWHVSGQKGLFERLDPGEIGISLNQSHLMHPLKSVSGVLVLAPIEVHSFSPAFPCCATCTTLDCQERAASLRSGSLAR